MNSQDDFIDDSEDRPMTKAERKDFDNLLNAFRQGVIKPQLNRDDKRSKEIKKLLREQN